MKKASLPSNTKGLFTLILGICIFICPPSQSQNPVIDSLKNVLDTTKGRAERATLLNDLAARLMSYSAEDCYRYSEEALNLSRQTDLKSEQGRALNYMASSKIYLNQFEEAAKLFHESKEVFESIGDKKGAADIIGNLGHLYHMLGEYSQALEMQFEALALFESIENVEGLNNTRLAIGSIYMENQQYDRALHYDSLALEGYEDMGDENGLAIVMGNMANVFMELEKMDTAKVLYEGAIELFKKTEDHYSLARELSNISTLYEKQRKLDLAIATSQEAATLFKGIGYATGYCYAIGNVGSYYYTAVESKKENEEAVDYPPGSYNDHLNLAISNLKEACDVALQSNDRKILSMSSETLSRALEDRGDLAEAYKYYKLYREIQDSTQSLELKEQIEQLTTERELAVKDKQIELDRLAVIKKRNERAYFIVGLGLLGLSLIMIYRNYINQKKSNLQLGEKNIKLNHTLTQLKETQNQLIESERQKERAELRTKISQDIHDDISSGLTKISWLSETLRSRHKQTTEASRLEPLIDKISKASRTTVSKLGEIIWSTSPGRDNLQSLFNYIQDQVTEFLEDSRIRPIFDFPLDAPDVTLNPELRRNLFLVCKEAVNNAFKYSEANQIKISFHMENNAYTLSIEDNGKGMDNTTVEGGGHGLKNMQHRMSSVNGQCNIHSIKDNGTVIECTGNIY